MENEYLEVNGTLYQKVGIRVPNQQQVRSQIEEEQSNGEEEDQEGSVIGWGNLFWGVVIISGMLYFTF